MAVMFMKIDTNCDGTVDWVSGGGWSGEEVVALWKVCGIATFNTKMTPSNTEFRLCASDHSFPRLEMI